MPRAKKVQTIDTHKFFKTGAKTVGVVAVQLTATSYKTKKGVLVKASSGNGTGLVYVGSSTVTANAADDTSGFELAASEWVELEVNDVSDVYVIGSEADLSVTWLIV